MGQFFQIVEDGDFYVDHIASQLFRDVVKFHIVGNDYAMRFTLQFWSFGFSIFHPEFIRFMAGLKALGTMKGST